jgi:hypothetical protein
MLNKLSIGIAADKKKGAKIFIQMGIGISKCKIAD